MKTTTTITVLLLLATAGAAHAQDRFALELRGGAAFPQELGNAELGTGAGAELSARFQFMPQLSVYGGWDWYRFATDSPFQGASYDVNDTGYAFGLHFARPLVGRTEAWVRAGGIYDHIEMEDDSGDIVGDTGHELGWEVGGGALIPLTNSLALTPGVRYRTFEGELDVGTGPVLVDLTYLTAEVGVSWTFGGRIFSAARSR